MKKINYYCLGKTKNDGIFKSSGYLYTDKNGNKYGCSWYGDEWIITEISTGLRINLPTYKVKSKSLIQPYIDMKADTVTKLLKQTYYENIIENFNKMVADFKATER